MSNPTPEPSQPSPARFVPFVSLRTGNRFEMPVGEVADLYLSSDWADPGYGPAARWSLARRLIRFLKDPAGPIFASYAPETFNAVYNHLHGLTETED